MLSIFFSHAWKNSRIIINNLSHRAVAIRYQLSRVLLMEHRGRVEPLSSASRDRCKRTMRCRFYFISPGQAGSMDGNLDSSCARVDEAKRLIGSHSKIEKSRARAYKKSVRMPCACFFSPPPPAVPPEPGYIRRTRSPFLPYRAATLAFVDSVKCPWNISRPANASGSSCLSRCISIHRCISSRELDSRMTTGPETVSFWAPRVRSRTLSVSRIEKFQPGGRLGQETRW